MWNGTLVGVGAMMAVASLGCGSQGDRTSITSSSRSARAENHRLVANAAPRTRPGTHRPQIDRLHVNALSTPSSAQSRCTRIAAPAPAHRLRHREWLTGVTITEYYPAPERWFVGRRVHAPGLRGMYAADWLYSARGLAMEGSGVDRHGRPVHIAELGSTGWVNAAGRPTVPVCLGKWSNGFPVWLIGGWRNHRGQVTFPLSSGGWMNGHGARTRPYGGVTFAAGSSTPARYYRSMAVDPRLIPLGSRVYVPAYRHIGGGWFIANDTGGAIKGRHIDIYRPPPASPSDEGRYMTRQRILVIPPS
jgi:3D (Asp-Asp-Asp) domain-containing protein